jgi:flagellar FliL protein
MAERTAESTRSPRGTEAAPATNGVEAPATPKAGSPIKAWLPVLLTVALMPVLAYVTTRFVLVPRVQRALVQQASGATVEQPPSDKPGESNPADPKTLKSTVPLTKVLVNVAGTMGTRYLMTSLTVVGAGPDFKGKIDDNRDQLMDLATSALSTKTIADLEKPGARNLIRTELMNTFNNALGGPVIKEIYITEMAIQ